MNKQFYQFEILKDKNINHGIFSKAWGNISNKFGDVQEVEKNRSKIKKFLKITTLVEMEQVHGSKIKILRDRNKIISDTDGIMTNKKGIYLMVKSADCFPLLVYDPVQKVIAAVHAGWRGIMEKIYLLTILKMNSIFKSQVKDIIVGIGPGIKACCFQHKNLLQEKLPEWKKYFKKLKTGLKSLDLSLFIKDQLVEAGIQTKNIELLNLCSGCDRHFFSHYQALKKGQNEGRFASIIGLR